MGVMSGNSTESSATRARCLPFLQTATTVNSFFEVEALKGHLLAHELHPIEALEGRFNADEPRGGPLVFAVRIGQGQLDAGFDRLALVHFLEEVVHTRNPGGF